MREGHVLKECQCEIAERLEMRSEAPGLAAYLRSLASRIEAGEIRHVALSVHLMPDVSAD